MADTVTKYRITCINSDTFVTDYLSDPPTVCPDGHALNSNETTIIDTIAQETVSLNDDPGQTQGYYRGKAYPIDITGPTGSVSEHEVEFRYNVKVYSLMLLPGKANIGDEITFCTAQHTPVGILTSGVTGVTGPGDFVINVNSTVTDNVKMGFCVHLTDGTTVEDLGEAIEIDGTAGTVTTTDGPTGDFASGSTVMLTVPRISDVPILSDHPVHFGLTNEGGTEAPPGTRGTLHYKNNDGKTKKFGFAIEVRY